MPYEDDEPQDSYLDDAEEWLIECPDCDGTGFQCWDDVMIDCPECGGTGWQ